MVCHSCGTNNERGFKFCVKCGSSLENPQEVNYEQVDMGGYHTEEEFSDNKSGFTFGAGTFVIRDLAPSNAASDIYTADELNDTDEEFDFSMYDEPYIPKLDTARVSMPNRQINNNRSMPQMNMQGMQNGQMNANRNMQNMPNMNMQGVQNGQMNANRNMQNMPNMNMQGMQNGQMNANRNMQNMPGMNMQGMQNGQMNANRNMQNMPGMNMQGMQNGQMNANRNMQNMPNMNMQGVQNQQMMYSQPQVMGYDPSGMPIYGQPMMYNNQPHIIGYDRSGMPVYGQPMMYSQPQIIGYDQSGMPIYGQPMMYNNQPQIMGYDQSDMPIYGQPQNAAVNIPQVNAPPEPKKIEPEKKKNSGDDFWDFFDGGKPKKHDDSADDFFGKSSHSVTDMGDLSADGLDFSKLKRNEKKKTDYMGDTPLVDASKLKQNDANKLNKFYMRQTEQVDASNLQANKHEKKQDIMGVTKEVDVSRLASAERYKTNIKMYTTADVNADDLAAYVPEHKKALMAEADHAVEAMPKRKEAYVDELDLIELPDYMQAKKTVKEDKAEIPSLPEVGIE